MLGALGGVSHLHWEQRPGWASAMSLRVLGGDEGQWGWEEELSWGCGGGQGGTGGGWGGGVLGRSEGVGLQSGVGGSWLGFPRGPGQGRSQHRVARSEGQSGCNSPWPAAVVGQGLEPHTVVRLPPPDLASPPLTADTGPALARGAPGDQGRDKVLAQRSQGEKGAGLQGRALPGKSQPSFPSREGQWGGGLQGQSCTRTCWLQSLSSPWKPTGALFPGL